MTPQEMDPDWTLYEGFWLGSLAAEITHHIQGHTSDAELRRGLNEFLRSPVADEELKALLKEIPSYGKNRRRR